MFRVRFGFVCFLRLLFAFLLALMPALSYGHSCIYIATSSPPRGLPFFFFFFFYTSFSIHLVQVSPYGRRDISGHFMIHSFSFDCISDRDKWGFKRLSKIWLGSLEMDLRGHSFTSPFTISASSSSNLYSSNFF